jgi:hypothetical protein
MRKSRRVEYVVYPPNYQPGNGFKTARTKLRAACLANAMGAGSTVVKNEWRRQRYTAEDGSKTTFTVFSTVDEWVFHPHRRRN